jgi:hypothetical protein
MRGGARVPRPSEGFLVRWTKRPPVGQPQKEPAELPPRPPRLPRCPDVIVPRKLHRLGSIKHGVRFAGGQASDNSVPGASEPRRGWFKTPSAPFRAASDRPRRPFP